MIRPALIETLESRRMFSVTAAMLAGPLTIGSTWTYDDGSSVTIKAPDEYDALDVVSTLSSPQNSYLDSTATDYEVLNPRHGLLEYESDYYEALVYPFGNNDRFTPAKELYPAVMIAGKTYVARYHSEYTAQAGEAGSTGVGSIETDRLTLVSNTPQSITVPAGTFSTYEIVDQSNGQTTTQWIAPGVGLVQSTESGGTEASTTRRLMSYSISGNPSGAQLVGRIVGAKIPTSIVAGRFIRTSVAVSLFNVGEISETGPVTLVVYANGSSTSTTIALGSMTTRSLAIQVDQATSLRIPIQWDTTGLYDTYNLSLVVTDAAGNAITTIPLTLPASDVTIAPASSTTDPLILSATTRAIVVTVTNNGNVSNRETGQLQVLGTSSATEPSDTSGATTLFQIPTVFNIKPGQTRKFVIHLNKTQVKTINAYTWLIANVVSADAGAVFCTALPLSP